MNKEIKVVGAVIERDGQILCAQRGGSGSLAALWEFPGGKIEPGESPRSALEREIEEELRCAIDVGELITTTRYEYPFGIVTLTTFYCSLRSGTPQLTEHSAVEWRTPSALRSLDWAPADIPAVELVMEKASQ
jgi:8-oxo-dGTP diphosphatase